MTEMCPYRVRLHSSFHTKISENVSIRHNENQKLIYKTLQNKPEEYKQAKLNVLLSDHKIFIKEYS